jgi:hypothetical protein
LAIAAPCWRLSSLSPASLAWAAWCDTPMEAGPTQPLDVPCCDFSIQMPLGSGVNCSVPAPWTSHRDPFHYAHPPKRSPQSHVPCHPQPPRLPARLHTSWWPPRADFGHRAMSCPKDVAQNLISWPPTTAEYMGSDGIHWAGLPC